MCACVCICKCVSGVCAFGCDCVCVCKLFSCVCVCVWVDMCVRVNVVACLCAIVGAQAHTPLVEPPGEVRIDDIAHLDLHGRREAPQVRIRAERSLDEPNDHHQRSSETRHLRARA